MNAYTDKPKENKSRAISNEPVQGNSKALSQVTDERKATEAPVSLQKMADNSPQSKRVAQLQAMANSYVLSPKGHIFQKKERQDTPQEPIIQLSRKGKGIGAVIGGAIGAIGFLAGPIVGAITTTLGAGLGAAVGEYFSGPDIAALQAELDRRLRAANSIAKTGGVLLFEQYIAECATQGNITSTNVVNARELLNMVWSLNQVCGYIIESVKRERPAYHDKIMEAYMSTVRAALGVSRQPWAGDNHAVYVANPDYFTASFSGPITYLNETFPGLPPAHKLRMLNSINGWNQEKGPPQLSRDLLITNYAPPPGKIVPVGEFINNAFYDTEDPIETLTAVPPIGTIVVDMKMERWMVNGVLATGVDLASA